MDNKLSMKFNNMYNEINIIQNNINKNLYDFKMKASNLVELSDDMYQIEKTIKLNKISLKGYVLDSSCCQELKKKNISNYTIKDLNRYLKQFEYSTNMDCSSYHLSLNLYQLLENTEDMIKDKIEKEINLIIEFSNLILEIKEKKSSEYEVLYAQIIAHIKENYLNKNLINNNEYEICIKILNDIFNFYINGYPNILE